MSRKPTYQDLEKRVAELEQQIEQYQIEAVKYRTLFDSFPHGITVTDMHGNIVETNAAAEQLVGVDKADHEKRKIDGREWRIVRSDESDMPSEEYPGVVALKERKPVSDCEMGIVKTDGKITWINVTAAPLPVKNDAVVITYSDITQRRKAEKDLRESEERFHQFFENTAFFGYIISTDGTILDVNKSALRALGYEKNELVGKPLSGIYAEESLGKVQTLFEKWKITGRVFNAEMVIKAKDGDKRWVILNVDSVKDGKGNIIHSTSVQVDITERKHTEEELRLYEIIVSSALEPMAVIDRNYTFLLVNKSYENFWGRSKKDIVGKKVYDILGVEVFENTVKEKVDRCLSGQRVNYSVWFRSPTKGFRFMSLNYYPYTSKNGDVMGLINVAYDLTKQKKYEDSLHEKEALLNRSQKMASMGSFIWDLRDDSLYWSKNMYVIHGLDKKSFKGNLSEVSGQLIHPDDRDRVREQIQQMIQSGRVWDMEFRIIRSDGCLRIMHSSGEFELDDKGQPVRCFGVHRDITEYKQSEQALRQSERELQQTLEATTDGIWTWHFKTNRLTFSARYYTMLGYEPDEFPATYESWLDLIHPEDRDYALAVAAKYLESKPDLYENEFRLKTKHGQYRWIHARARVVERDENNDAVYMIGNHEDVTRNKLAESALRESEEKFRDVVSSMPGAVYQFIRSPDGMYEIPFMSEGAARLFNMPVDELMDASRLFKNLHPDDVNMMWLSIDKSARDMSVWSQEFRIFVKAGKTKWLRGVSSPRKFDDGSICWSGVLIDVTEQKIAQRELSALASVVESSDDIIVVKDLDLHVVATNLAFARASGNQNVAVMLGKTDAEIFGVTPDTEPVKSYMDDERQAQKLPQGKYILREEPVVYPDGSSRTFLTKKYPIYDGNHLIGTGNISRDITDYKKMEQALKESEEKYRSMMEAMDEGTYICSSDFRIEYINPAMIRKIGRDATGEICYHAIHGLDEQCPWCEHERVMKGETVKTELSESIKGEVFFVSHSPIFHTNGTVSKLSVYRDITEIKKLEARIQQAQKMESIGNLAGGIAHDFNNILFPIMGMSELLMEDFPPGSQEYENAQEIFKAGKRGRDLVKQILAFSRQSKHKLIPVRIQQILKEVLRLSRSTIPAYIQIYQDIQTDCGLVMADPIQIHQVIMNVITNAYHAVELNGGSITVNLHETSFTHDRLQDVSLPAGRYACISIADTGIGMSPDLMDKIFEPYFTTKEMGKGTGLGLAVAYGIIREHKGEIKAASQKGEGSTFSIYLPLMNKSDKNDVINDVEVLPTGTEHILLVDDEAPITKIEQQMLQRLGYKVTSRLSSLDALEAFKTCPNAFDLVISDMSMPHMAGDELAKNLKNIRPELPVIICTGFSERINNTDFHGMVSPPNFCHRKYSFYFDL